MHDHPHQRSPCGTPRCSDPKPSSPTSRAVPRLLPCALAFGRCHQPDCSPTGTPGALGTLCAPTLLPRQPRGQPEATAGLTVLQQVLMLFKGVLAFHRAHNSQRVFLAALATLNTSPPCTSPRAQPPALPKPGVQHLTWHKSTALDAHASLGSHQPERGRKGRHLSVPCREAQLAV